MNYNLSKKEFWQSRNLYFFKIRKIHLKFFMCSIALLFLWFGLDYLNELRLFWLFVGFVLLYFLSTSVNTYFKFFISSKNIQKNNKYANIVISENEILFYVDDLCIENAQFKAKGDNIQWSYSWESVKKVLADNKFIILFLKNNSIFTIPKRLMSTEDLKLLNNFLSVH